MIENIRETVAILFVVVLIVAVGAQSVQKQNEYRAWALKDLDQVPYQEKQKQIEKVYARMPAAESICRKRVKDLEEFPSTVSYDMLGTSSEVTSVENGFIAVHVDYTAKNSSGAELPYRVSCVVDRDGNITYQYHGGR